MRIKKQIFSKYIDSKEKDNVTILAIVISLIFNTPLTALYELLLIGVYWPNAFAPLPFTLGFGIGFFFLLFMPVLTIVIGVMIGNNDLFVSEKSKRGSFYILALASQFVGIIISYLVQSPMLLLLHICYFATTLSIGLINIKTKISVHIAGIAGPIAFLSFLIGPLQLIWCIFVIPVAWSRLKLKAHTPMQLTLGFFVSFIITSITILGFLTFF